MQAHCEGCGALQKLDERGCCWYCGTPSAGVKWYPCITETKNELGGTKSTMVGFPPDFIVSPANKYGLVRVWIQ